jgi:hypothetical protein
VIALPIETTKFTGLFCAVEPTPKLADRETGEVKKDRASGQTLYQVGVCAMANAQAEVITVTVAGEPKGVVRGIPLQVRDLTASTWEVDGRHGVSFRAAAIAPLSAPTVKAAA